MKQRLRSGGFEVEYTDGADRGRITASHQAGKGEWEAAARLIGQTPDLTAYAYCKKKRKRT